MALITLKNNRRYFVSAKQGIAIWRILNGEVRGNKKQRRFCDLVDKVYLNQHTAPHDYLDRIRDTDRPDPIQYALPYKDD